MGICLDTDQQNGSQVFEEADARNSGRWRREAGLLATPPGGNFPMQNEGEVKFISPTVPVVFVLGGPGSGKVTHCDNLTQEKRGIVHINMTDLLQQYTLGNDMQDFGLLSSKTVTEVLMLEMKMSPGAKTFLVSGYPRNMRDVVEYSEKIQIVNGVILVAWKQEVLERQIDYGAQLGQVVLGLARMELQNFYKNVMPVAEYFDQSDMLVMVNGERNPSEVYVDFREAVLRVIGFVEEEAPREEVSRSVEAEVEVERHPEMLSPSPTIERITNVNPPPVIIKSDVKQSSAKDKRKGLPSFIWVIGGPGSNKANLCIQAVRNTPRWAYVSVGSLLSAMTSTNSIVHDAIVAGELVPNDIVMNLLEQNILLNRDNDGIVIDGFPRDLSQVQEFEKKFGQQPSLVLLDCSKLEMGRGRLQDTVQAFRKRLDNFRELTLPMLKTMDNDTRLTIIDGDTEIPSVQQEFAAAMYQLMRQARRKEEHSARIGAKSPPKTKNETPNALAPDKINGGLKMANGRSMANGIVKKSIPNGVANGIAGGAKVGNGILKTAAAPILQNGIANGGIHIIQNGGSQMLNGYLPNKAKNNKNITNKRRDPVRSMYNEVDGYQQNLHM